jgi:hypothetical protein
LFDSYNFRLLDTLGWNFRHAHFHEEGRRTLYKAYGVKFVIIVQGRAGRPRQEENNESLYKTSLQSKKNIKKDNHSC